MRLELDNDAMKGLVSEAIFQSFDEQKRDALVKSALEQLLQPAKDGYGNSKGKSPLQSAFEDALAMKAREVANLAVNERPEIVEAINLMVIDALKKFTEDGREAMVEKMADAIRKGITGDRY